MPLSIERRMLLGFGFVMLLILLTTLVSLHASRKQRDLHRLVDHTHRVQNQTTQLLARVNQAQSRARGFLITGDVEFLEKEPGRFADIKRELEHLGRLTADNPTQQANMGVLRHYVSEFVSIKSKMIQATKAGRPQEARAIVLSGQGMAVNQHIEQTLLTLRQEEERLLQRRTQAADQFQHNTDLLAIALHTVMLLALGGVFAGVHHMAQAKQNSLDNLAANEARLQAILDTAVDGIVAIDSQGTIETFNPAAEKMFGYTEQEVLGQNITLLMPFSEAAHHHEYLARHLSTGKRIDIGFKRDLQARRKDGSLFPVTIAVGDMLRGDTKVFVGILRDTTERKAADERFRVLFEHSSDAHLLFDDTGIVDCNDAAIRMLNCADKAAVLTLHPAVLSPEFQPDGRRSLEKCQEMDALARANGYHRFEWIHRKADGTDFPVEVTLTPVTLSGKDTLLVVWHDLTERKQHEAALQLAKERLQFATESGELGVWEYDISTQALTWNDRMMHLYGFTPETFPGAYEAWEVRLHPYDKPHAEAALIEAIAGRRKFDPEFRIVLPDGTLRFIQADAVLIRDENGNPTRMIGLNRDITERKQIEIALQQSEQRMRDIVENLPAGAVFVDGERISLNREAEELTGYSREELPTLDIWFQAVHPGRVEQVRALYEQQKAMNFPPAPVVPVTCKDGTLRQVEFVGYTWATGEVWLLHDMTERYAMEEAMRRSEARLKEAQSIAQIGSWEYDLASGRITWSDEMYRLFAFDPADSPPSYEQVMTRYHPEDVAMHDAAVEKASQDGTPYQFDIRAVMADGTVKWFHNIGKTEIGPEGKPVRQYGTVRDVTLQKQYEERIEANNQWLAEANQQLTEQREELEATNSLLESQMLLVNEQATILEVQKAELEQANVQLEALATTDGLTGIANHRAFQDRLAQECKRAERNCTSFSLILLDVDRFKQYNDSFGHPEGDVVLKQVARILQETTRRSDFVARYGGEEFVILLPETGAKGATEMAERLRVMLEAQEWPHRPITASFGVATLNDTTETGAALVEAADRALYVSKDNGRNRVTHASSPLCMKK